MESGFALRCWRRITYQNASQPGRSDRSLISRIGCCSRLWTVFQKSKSRQLSNKSTWCHRREDSTSAAVSQQSRLSERLKFSVAAGHCPLPLPAALNSLWLRALKSSRSTPTSGNRHIRERFCIRPIFGAFTPSELPAHDVLVASIPCTSHSTLGRAKKSLAGKPELGDTGDLFLSVAHIVAHHLPSACVFENVPAFGNSLACLSLAQHLQKIGYSLTESIIDPLNEWNEPQDRKRWIMIATLKPGFQIRSPQIPFTGTVGEFLDAPADSDRLEVERIVKSIEALRRHNQRHAKLGHGFGFTTINRESARVPTIVRSYHKINTGPFVETAVRAAIAPQSRS